MTTLIALFGLLSGLLVDVVVAGRFGAGFATDAFFIGARLPLAVAVIVLVGANQALVPAVAAWLAVVDAREAGRRTCAVGAIAVCVGGVMAAALILGSRQIAAVQAPGLSDEGIRLAARVLEVMALTLPTTALGEVLRAYLNAQRAFVVPALVNVVLNVTVMGVVLSEHRATVITVAWGYVLGSLLRVLLLVIMSLQRGLALNPLPALRTREPWQAASLCLRPLAGAGLAPVVRTVEQALASALPTGSISLLNYAYRLVTGVGGAVLFRSVIVTLVPRLTEALALGRGLVARELTSLGMRLMLLVSLPLAAFTAVLAKPAVHLLFERGRFDARAASELGLLLTLFAASMPPDGISRAQMAPYFSKLNTRLPWRNSLLGMAVNLALLPLALLPRSPTVALVIVALAYVVSRWVTVLHGQFHLRRDGLAAGAKIGSTLGLLLPALVGTCALMAGLAQVLHLYTLVSSPQLAVGLAATAASGTACLVMALWSRRRVLVALVRTPRDDIGVS